MTAVIDLPDLSRRFLAAQLSADRDGAVRVLIDEGLSRGVAVEALLMEVIRPAQFEIGRLWETNAISIADEHQATAIAQLALAQLYSHAERTADTGRRLVVACVEGEQHDMGARIAADLLDAQGHTVVFLGADLPVESLVEKVRREQPDMVVLSITMTFHVDALVRAVEALRSEVSASLPIAAGGHALQANPDLARELRLAASGGDARVLVDAVRTFFTR